MGKPTTSSPLNTPSHSTLHNFHVNVKMFGAVGDGVADDGASIQAAYDALGDSGLLYFPAGTYKISSAINVGSATAFSHSIQGTQAFGGANSTAAASKILQTNLSAHILNVTLTSGQGNSLIIEGLQLVYNGTGTGTAIKTSPSTWTGGLTVRDVFVQNAGIGAEVKYLVSPIFSNVVFVSCGTAGVDLQAEVNLPTFENCYFQSGAIGLRVSGLVYGLRMTSSVLESQTGPAVKIAASGSLRGAHFDSCWWEFPGTDMVEVAGLSSGLSGLNWKFTNAHFNGSNGSGGRHILNNTQAQGTNGVVFNTVFDSCQFANLNGGSILTVAQNPTGSADPGWSGVAFINCYGTGPIKGCFLPLYGASSVLFNGPSGPKASDLIAGTAGQFPYFVDLRGGTKPNSAITIGAGSDYGGIGWTPENSTTPDTNLYRSAANVLKTDDKLVAALGLGVGNSASATTPSSVVRKMEVFDASGASLGFLPIYSSIA